MITNYAPFIQKNRITMDKKQNRFIQALEVLIILLVVGCTSTSAPSLSGTYIATITKQDSFRFSGEWKITFTDDGHYTVVRNGALKVEGIYTLMQDQLEITDRSGPYMCTGKETATY